MCLFSTTRTNRDIDDWDEPRPHRGYYSAHPEGSARKASLPASASYTSVDRYTEYDRSHRGGGSTYGERDDRRQRSRQRQRSSVRSVKDYRDSRDRYDYQERDTVNVRRYSRVEREYSRSRSRSTSRTRSRSRSRTRSRSRVVIPIARAKSRHRSQSRPVGPVNIVRVDRNPSRKRSTRHRRSTSISKVQIIKPEEDTYIYAPRSPRVVRAIMPAPVLVEPAPRIQPQAPYVRTIPSQPNISRVIPATTTYGAPAVLRPYTPSAAAAAAEVREDFIPVGEMETLEDVGTFAGIEVDKVKREVVGYPRYEIRAPRY